MSSLARWSYTNQVTIWPVTYDDYSQAIYGTPYLIMADWMVGGEVSTDSSGNQIVPVSTYYFEAADGDSSIPVAGYMILRGDYTAIADPSTIENTEKIKKVGGWVMTAFGSSEIPDWQILT